MKKRVRRGLSLLFSFVCADERLHRDGVRSYRHSSQAGDIPAGVYGAWHIRHGF